MNCKRGGQRIVHEISNFLICDTQKHSIVFSYVERNLKLLLPPYQGTEYMMNKLLNVIFSMFTITRCLLST